MDGADREPTIRDDCLRLAAIARELETIRGRLDRAGMPGPSDYLSNAADDILDAADMMGAGL